VEAGKGVIINLPECEGHCKFKGQIVIEVGVAVSTISVIDTRSKAKISDVHIFYL